MGEKQPYEGSGVRYLNRKPRGATDFMINKLLTFL